MTRSVACNVVCCITRHTHAAARLPRTGSSGKPDSLPCLGSGPEGPARAGSGLKPLLAALAGGAALSAATLLRRQPFATRSGLVARATRRKPRFPFAVALENRGPVRRPFGRRPQPLRGANQGGRAVAPAPRGVAPRPGRVDRGGPPIQMLAIWVRAASI